MKCDNNSKSGAKHCFFCGKKKRGASIFYNLDKDGHIICQSCLQNGYAKTALEIIEHNKQAARIAKTKEAFENGNL